MTNLIATGVPTETQHLRPSTLNTVEKELAWALLLFHRLNSEKDLLFRDNANPKQISYQRFYGQDGNIYLGGLNNYIHIAPFPFKTDKSLPFKLSMDYISLNKR
jgi:hypothetical protein